MRYGFGTAVVLALVFVAAAARAEDRALVIGNRNYADAADISGASDAARTADALRAAGFSVVSDSDLTASALRDSLSGFLQSLAPQDRVVILLSGHFAQSAGQTWFLGVDASLPDLASVGAAGVDLATVMEVAGQSPGRAVVLLGSEDRRLPLDKGLTPGIGSLTPPQGVALVQGDAREIARFAASALTTRGQSLAVLLQGAGSLSASGFLSLALEFRPDLPPATVLKPTPVDPGQTAADRTAEERLWGDAQRAGTIAGFEAYLTRYPDGRFAALGRAEVNRLRNDPQLQAEMAESALGLDRDQRRTVQRQLSMLGFNPRGIDGVFGRGSRAAIVAWQDSIGAEASGFLTGDQIVRLTAQADRRAAELEAEAAARKADQDRQDRLYWQQTGSAGDEAGLRAYLKRHPDGLFADLATDRLAVFEDQRRAEAAAQDRAAWDAAMATNSVESYRAYLREFPKGVFAADANSAIEALTEEAEGGADRAQAEAAEAALGLNPLARTLVQRRLAGLGFDPGRADGEFDERTRRAIRRFQASRGQTPTGFLDQQAMVSLLAGGIIKLGE